MKKILLLAFIIFVLNSCSKKIDLGFDTLSLQAASELNNIAVWNKDTIAVCGGSRYTEGDIYISYDRGNTWKAHEKVIDKALYKICFVDGRHLFATGYDGKFMISTDYGQTWQYHQLDYLPMYDIKILSPNEMVVCGGGGYRTGIIYRLKMDGSILQRDTFVNEFRSVDFTDSLHGFCCGYGLVMKTSDGAKTWMNTSARGDFFKSIRYNGSNIYTMGMTGTLLTSSDNGDNWNDEISGDGIIQTDVSLNALLTASSYSIMCGNNGKILFKSGADWEKVKSPPDVNFSGIAIVNNKAWLTAADGKIHVMNLP